MTKSLDSVESFWSSELGEDVEIGSDGWEEYPSEYSLYLSGGYVSSFKTLEEVEDYLNRYFCVKEEA